MISAVYVSSSLTQIDTNYTQISERASSTLTGNVHNPCDTLS